MNINIIFRKGHRYIMRRVREDYPESCETPYIFYLPIDKNMDLGDIFRLILKN